MFRNKILSQLLVVFFTGPSALDAYKLIEDPDIKDYVQPRSLCPPDKTNSHCSDPTFADDVRKNYNRLAPNGTYEVQGTPSCKVYPDGKEATLWDRNGSDLYDPASPPPSPDSLVRCVMYLLNNVSKEYAKLNFYNGPNDTIQVTGYWTMTEDKVIKNDYIADLDPVDLCPSNQTLSKCDKNFTADVFVFFYALGNNLTFLEGPTCKVYPSGNFSTSGSPLYPSPPPELKDAEIRCYTKAQDRSDGIKIRMYFYNHPNKTIGVITYWNYD